MSKHFEFGKDLGLMVQVVNTGLSVGVGHWEFWETLSKPHKGMVWFELLDFLEKTRRRHPPTLAEMDFSGLQCREPDIYDLDKVVREGRAEGFGKREWTVLAESKETFRDLANFLTLAWPHYWLTKVVDYDVDPTTLYTPEKASDPFPSDQDKSGRVVCDMSIYVHSSTRPVMLLELETKLKETGWRLGDQYELSVFGRSISNSIRPCAFLHNGTINGLGSQNNSSGEHDWLQYPVLWGRKNGAEPSLKTSGVFHRGEGVLIRPRDSILIVRDTLDTLRS